MSNRGINPEFAWHCAEHGVVLEANWRSNIEFSVVHFCPLCNRELFRDDPLSEIERGGRQPATLPEYLEEQSGL